MNFRMRLLELMAEAKWDGFIPVCLRDAGYALIDDIQLSGFNMAAEMIREKVNNGEVIDGTTLDALKEWAEKE